MKKLMKFSSVMFLGLACATLPALARENHEEVDDQEMREPVYSSDASFQRYDSDRGNYEGRGYRRHDGLGRLQREVDHLNGMLAHVRNNMRRYGASRDVWRHYGHVQGEVRRINWQFRRGEQYYNRRRLLVQIEHMHDELHEIEQKLRMPSRFYFRWGG
jgi:hypothetical protein